MRALLVSAALCFSLSACGAKDDAPETTPAVQAPAQAAPKTVTVLPKPAAKPSLNPEMNGKKFYKKCAACHRPNGDGIPGSFPSLNQGIDSLAATQAGREYLVLVINNGLRGTLETNRGTYTGVMVRQGAGKSSADISDVLNYVLASFYPEYGGGKFTSEEAHGINTKLGRMSGDKVLALRPEGQ